MIINKTGQIITTLDEWERLAPPKSPAHWQNDRSAKEVARAWLEAPGAKIPAEIQALLSSHPRFGEVLSGWRAQPEARLRFDDFPGEPRNSDLLVNAVDSFGPFIMAVEAKADESYGETVADALATALERNLENPRSNGIARIRALAMMLFEARLNGAPKVASLRYQLLTASAGAICAARDMKIARVVLIVHEFATSKTSDVNHDRNLQDLKQFIRRLGGPTTSSVPDSLCGPFKFSDAAGVELFVGKAMRNLRT